MADENEEKPLNEGGLGIDDDGMEMVEPKWKQFLNKVMKRRKGEQKYSANKDRWRNNWLYMMIFFQCMEIIFWMAMLGRTDERLGDEPEVVVKYGAEYPQRVISAQYIVTLICFLVCIGGLLFTFLTYMGDNISRLFDLVLLKAITIVMDIFLLAFFTYGRLGLITMLAIFQVFTVLVIFRLTYTVNSAAIDMDSLRDVPTIMRSLLKMRSMKNDVEGMPLHMNLLEKLLTWLSGYDAARTFSGDGRRKLVVISIFIFLLTVGLFSYNHMAMKTSDRALMEKTDLDYIMDNPSKAEVEGWTYNADGDPVRLLDTATYGSTSVVLIMVDGISHTQFNLSSSMQSVVNRYYDDMLMLRLRSEVPTVGLPTWLQIIAGVRPDTVGVRGDYQAGNISVDTLFHQMKRTGTPSAVTSVPWFTSLFQDSIDPLVGDGSISAEFRDNPNLEDYIAEQDDQRVEAVIKAMHSPNRYGMILGHLFGPNYAGHFYGTENLMYDEALDRAAGHLDMILSNVTDPNQIVLIISNHGHLVGGGTGGGSNNIVHVPLIAYKMGSQVRDINVPRHYPRDPQGLPRLYDVCSTIAAIMGVPVPRHNQGFFIDALVTSTFVHPSLIEPMRADLFYQQQAFTDRWMRKIGFDPGQLVFNSDYLTNRLSPGPAAGVYELINLHNETVMQNHKALQARNIGASLLLIVSVTVIILYIIQTFTIADPMAVFRLKLFETLTEWERSDNVKCFKLALLCTMAYWSSVFAIFIFIAFLARQGEFDSSYIHRMRYEMLYVFSIIIPGAASSWFVSRVIGLAMSNHGADDEEEFQLADTVKKYVYDVLFAEINITEPALHHVLHLYLLYLSLFVEMWTVFGASTVFCFAVPPTFRIPSLTAATWQAQFQFNTAIGMGLPLVAYSGLVVYRWSHQRVDNYVLFEMNRIKTDKSKRYRDKVSVDLGTASKAGWELPDVNDLENPGARRHFARLSDWYLDVSASYTLTSAEKRRLIGEQFTLFSREARHAGQERGLILHQQANISQEFDDAIRKVMEMEEQVRNNHSVIGRGLPAIQEVIAKEMHDERKALLAMGKKTKWAKNPQLEETRRVSGFILERMREHEDQKLKVLVESRKAYLLSKNKAQKTKDIKEVRRMQRNVVEQTMDLITKHERLDNEVGSLNSKLDEIVARIKEFEVVKKRQAEGFSEEILIHQKIQRDIMEELKKEADYHMYIHNLIDGVTEDINDKESKISQANTDSRDIEQRIEQVIEKLIERIETARNQKLALFREVKTTVNRLQKVRRELRENREWAREYKEKLKLFQEEM